MNVLSAEKASANCCAEGNALASAFTLAGDNGKTGRWESTWSHDCLEDSNSVKSLRLPG